MGSHRESLRHRARLVYRFLIFKARVRVRDDAGAGLEVRFPVFQYGAAQRDARIDVTIEPEIADRPRVATATCFFQFADNLHRPNFRRAGDSPSRKGRFNHIEGAAAVAQPASDIRDNMHDVAVTLDIHHLSYAHRAEIGDAANIVARKIDKHDVLSPLFWIGEEFGGIAFVLRDSRAMAPRSCDRTNLNSIADKPDVPHRLAADKREIVTE